MEEDFNKEQSIYKQIENNSPDDKILNKIFLAKYIPIQKIGQGAFCSVYKAKGGDEFVAMKFENRSNEYEYLEEESMIMRYLKGPQIPIIKCFWKNIDYNILIMELLGNSLEYNFQIKKKFYIQTTAMLGYQMLNILEFIHEKHIIHRDIKPDNFLMGLNQKNAVLYLLDFGLAKKFRSSKTLIQCPFVKKKKMTGTARYASIHALEEMELSRRDDLESMAYVLLYFLRGSLPWQGIKIKEKENRLKKILAKKKETTSDELCENLPEEFKYLVDYARNLGYTENPDYEKLRQNFLILVKEKMCCNFDFVYDWTTENDIQQRDDNIDILNGIFEGNKDKNNDNNIFEKENELNNENDVPEKENEINNENNLIQKENEIDNEKEKDDQMKNSKDIINGENDDKMNLNNNIDEKNQKNNINIKKIKKIKQKDIK